MSFKIIKAGLQTSLQDLGRKGYRRFGISQAGAIDSFSFKMANWLVSNHENSPCLEIYLIGPTIEFQTSMAIAITGGNFDIWLNDKLIAMNKTHSINAGDILKFGKRHNGARAYLAFSGSLNIPPTLESYSSDTTSGISSFVSNQNRSYFSDGDLLETQNSNQLPSIKIAPKSLIPVYTNRMVLRVTKGLEFKNLTNSSQQRLFQEEFKVSANSNRMGVRLEKAQLDTKCKIEMVSSPITTGTIQLPQNGNPIITSNEGQTVGGYPRIAQVISADLPLLGQCAPSDLISFYPINHRKASKVYHAKSNLLEN